MMKIKYFFCVSLLIAPFFCFAGEGPTGIGVVSIGMSKADYISAIGISPVNCNIKNDKRSEMKYLQPDTKTLCYGSIFFDKTGSTENIQVSGISYDVVEANYESSKFIKSVGHNSKAIFFNGRLISFEIMFPEVSLETLTSKYGAPRLVDNRQTEVCKNRTGNEFENQVGNVDAVWINGKVSAKLRADTSSPRETCTDGITMHYYILEEEQLKVIEDAINEYRASLAKKEASESPF